MDLMTSTPEEKARKTIDRMLDDAGWVIQNIKEFNPGAGPGIAVREYPTDTGEADYVLSIDRKPVGVIEAKKEGIPLSNVEEQAERYGKSELKYIRTSDLPFIYASTGIETRCTDNRDPAPRAREIYSFPQPATLQEWLQQENPLRKRLQQIPPLDPKGLRKCRKRP